jgi:hypothetical protein
MEEVTLPSDQVVQVATFAQTPRLEAADEKHFIDLRVHLLRASRD